MEKTKLLRRIRIWLAIFISGLILSGLTAFPLRTELRLVASLLQHGAIRRQADAVGLLPWIQRVNQAVRVTDSRYPFLAYGTDWLAFAHLVIAIAFTGPFLDPVRN